MSSIACLPVLTYHYYKLQINLLRDYKKGYLLSYTCNIRQFISLTFGKEHNKFENLQTQNFMSAQVKKKCKLRRKITCLYGCL